MRQWIGSTMRAVGALGIMWLISGCANLPFQQQQAHVTLTNLAMGQMSLLAQEYLVELEIQNPTPEPLSINGIQYTLKLNGRDFANGVGKPGVEIPPFSSKRVTVPMSSSVMRIVDQFNQFKNTSFTYELTGSLYLQNSSTPLSFNVREALLNLAR